jgi:hypothetical protein
MRRRKEERPYRHQRSHETPLYHPAPLIGYNAGMKLQFSVRRLMASTALIALGAACYTAVENNTFNLNWYGDAAPILLLCLSAHALIGAGVFNVFGKPAIGAVAGIVFLIITTLWVFFSMRFRFTIRDLLWLAVVVALAAGWLFDKQLARHRKHNALMAARAGAVAQDEFLERQAQALSANPPQTFP